MIRQRNDPVKTHVINENDLYESLFWDRHGFFGAVIFVQ